MSEVHFTIDGVCYRKLPDVETVCDVYVRDLVKNQYVLITCPNEFIRYPEVFIHQVSEALRTLLLGKGQNDVPQDVKLQTGDGDHDL